MHDLANREYDANRDATADDKFILRLMADEPDSVIKKITGDFAALADNLS